MNAIRDFCRRWKIVEFALFGSVLRDDFGAESDVDVLVTFEPDATWSLLDRMRAQDELSDLLGRPVDLINRRGVEEGKNPFRRKNILRDAHVIYAV